MDMSRGSRFKDGIRIAAGAYLVYLGITLIRDGYLGGAMTGITRTVGLIAGIAFIILGPVIIIYSLKSAIKAQKAEIEAAEEADKEAEANVEESSDEDAEFVPKALAEANAAVEAEKAEKAQKSAAASKPASIFDKAMGSIQNTEEDAE